MKGLLSLTWIDLKLSLRNFVATFFTLAFPVLMILLFGSMYGNAPIPDFGGYGAMDVSIPGYIAALLIGSTGLMSLPIELVSRRQRGVLRRFRASPLSPASVLCAQLLVNLALCLLGSALLLLAGTLVWRVRLPTNLLALAPAFLLCCASQFSLGFLVASFARSAKTAFAVSMALFYPMMFLSGGTLPMQFLPKAIQDASRFFPMTWCVTLLKDIWFGRGWNPVALLVLAGTSLLCALLSVLFFKWE